MKAQLRDLGKGLLYRGVNAMAYRIRALGPTDEHKAVFLEMRERKPPQDYTLVMRELESRGYRCEFLSLGRWGLPGWHYLARCLRMSWVVAGARLVFLNDANMPFSCLPLRAKTRAVQLWHACGAFKRFGMSAAKGIFGGTQADMERFPHYGNLTLVTVSSPEVVWAYEEAMSLEGTGIVRPLGVSRTDDYFDAEFVSSCRSRMEQVVPAARDKRILLYAPTFRGDVDAPTAPDALDLALLHERLGEDWYVLVKQHPFVGERPPVPETCSGFARDVTDDLPIDVLLCSADALVTDYSSVVFEYSLLGRPMAFFAFDKDDYDDWRGFYYDYEDMTPGPVLRTTDEIASWAAALDGGFDTSAIDDFRERFMSSCDGHSTQRILDIVV